MPKYYYDSKTLMYRPAPRQWVKKVGVTALCGLALGLAFAVVMDLSSTSFQEVALRSEKLALQEKLAQTYEQIEASSEKLDELSLLDRELYRIILQADDIPSDVLQAGVGGTDPYREYDRFSPPVAQLLRNSTSMLDQLERKLSLQNSSYRELERLAHIRRDALTQLPSIKPTEGRLVSNFGQRLHPILGVKRPHSGIDIATPTGTPVRATGDGIILTIDNAPSGYGRYIVVEHPEAGYRTLYAHLSTVTPGIYQGKKVKRGEQIALSGNTGYSVGPHLHYEVLDLNNRRFDPRPFILNMSPVEYFQLLATSDSDSASAAMDY